MTVIASPSRIFPPTNSLPPLRCLCPPGLTGPFPGEPGAAGGGVGLRNVASGAKVDGNEAPGLNEKFGRAGDRDLRFSKSVAVPKAIVCGSIADRGLLPVAREKDGGAQEEEEDGRIGKTKGGFGGGGMCFSDVCVSEGESLGLPADSA